MIIVFSLRACKYILHATGIIYHDFCQIEWKSKDSIKKAILFYCFDTGKVKLNFVPYP